MVTMDDHKEINEQTYKLCILDINYSKPLTVVSTKLKTIQITVGYLG